MNSLRIHVDLHLQADVRRMLEEGTRGHELVFPGKPVSVLSKGENDAEFETVEVAFGQPDTVAIERARQLRWVHVSSSGITRYDTPQFRALAAERGIVVTNSASVYSGHCAEHVFSFMLAQARSLPVALKTRAASGTPEWDALRSSGRPLEGQSVVILGYGAIGKRLVELLRPFGMKMMAYRRKARGDEGVPVLDGDRLAEVLAGGVDHVVNILPASDHTRHFFNAKRFAGMNSGAIFYNIGRGSTVDQDALVDALRSKRLTAAWLDVTEPEPLPEGHPLWELEDCHITPHVAGGHAGEDGSLVRHFLRNLERFVHGEAMLDRVM